MENLPNQSPKPANKALWIVIVIIILAVAGYGIYIYVSGNTNNANNINATNNTNRVANTNSSQPSRITLNRVDDKNVISHEDFSLEIPSNWYTTEITNSGNKNLLFTASNENTDDVLGISNRETGFVMDILAQNYSGNVKPYLEEHPVNAGTLVRQNEINIGDYDGMLREIDSTSVDSMEGSYSLNYLVKVNDNIIEILFLGLTKNGIEKNRTVIEEVMQSFK